MGPRRSTPLRLSAAALGLGASLVLSAPSALANAGEAAEEVKKEQTVDAACGGAAVAIDGGDVTTDTTLDLSADGGTGIADASGGGDNDAVDITINVAGDSTGDDGIVAAGNGGTADASANGGAIGVGDINSGDNTGGQISVGDVGCADGEEATAVESAQGAADDKKAAEQTVVLSAASEGAEEVSGGAAVAIDGGDVTTTTTLDVSADAGVAIADAAGGDTNDAVVADITLGGGADDGTDGTDDDGTDDDIDDLDDVSDALDLIDDLLDDDEGDDGGTDDAASDGSVVAAGNGGTADAFADGGVVTVGDINSGGNEGSTIEVGDVGTAPDAAPAPVVVVEQPEPVAPAPVAEQPKPIAPEAAVPVTEAPKPVAPAAPVVVEQAPAAPAVEQPKEVVVVEQPRAAAPAAPVAEKPAAPQRAVVVTATDKEIVLNVPAQSRDRVARATTTVEATRDATVTRAVRMQSAAADDGRARGAAATVAALPSTGTGVGLVRGATTGESLLLVAGPLLAAGAAGLALRRRIA